jgi:hypothetical protein
MQVMYLFNQDNAHIMGSTSQLRRQFNNSFFFTPAVLPACKKVWLRLTADGDCMHEACFELLRAPALVFVLMTVSLFPDITIMVAVVSGDGPPHHFYFYLFILFYFVAGFYTCMCEKLMSL